MATAFRISLITVVLFLPALALGQGCDSATSCSHCLDLSPGCRWCSSPDNDKFPLPANRCALNFPEGACKPKDIVKLDSQQQVLPSPDFSDTVQVTPSAFSVTLAPHGTVELKVSVKPALNYPIDVYYLMDHSASMDDDLTTLKKQAQDLADAISDISTNYQIGYGTYVDKESSPFMLTGSGRVLNQCFYCKHPYSFYNNRELSSDVNSFKQAVSMDQISGNFDTPEGTFDAMMQAAVCSEIGWREKARRILLVVTDALFHSAGDGKFAGVIVPHDGKCYLNSQGYYTKSLELDFPSVSYLTFKLQEQHILPIFSVTDDVGKLYDLLVKEMAGAGAVRLSLNNDSSNIVDLLKRELARQISVANIVVLNTGLIFDITAQCPGNSKDRVNNFDICNKMVAGQAADYTIKITAPKCEVLSKLTNVTLRFVGFGDVVININSNCDCPCETAPMRNDSFCQNRGTNACGLCSCEKGFSGSMCECDNDDTKCRNGSVLCNGRGVCECGICKCTSPDTDSTVATKREVNGKFCECDNFNCPKDDSGAICGDNGRCECGKCNCTDGFTGASCDCPRSAEKCRPPLDGSTVCNSEGSCVCGKCSCLAGFSGEFCDICKNRTACEQIDQCARSKICLTCTNTEECPLCRGTLSIDPPTGSYWIEETIPMKCKASSGGCDYFYWVATNENVTGSIKPFFKLHVENEKSCPESFNYFPLIFGIVFGLVAAGILLLLLYRLILYYRYRQEYRRFLELQKKQVWQQDVNPIFQGAVQTFPNPQYQIK